MKWLRTLLILSKLFRCICTYVSSGRSQGEDWCGDSNIDIASRDALHTHYVYDWRLEQEARLRKSRGTGMTDEQVVKFVDGCKLPRRSSLLVLLMTSSQTILLMSYSQMDCGLVYCPAHLVDNSTLLSRRTERSTPMKFCENLQPCVNVEASFGLVLSNTFALEVSDNKIVSVKPPPYYSYTNDRRAYLDTSSNILVSQSPVSPPCSAT